MGSAASVPNASSREDMPADGGDSNLKMADSVSICDVQLTDAVSNSIAESFEGAVKRIKDAEKAQNIEEIVSAFTNHAGNATVALYGCWAIRNLSLSNEGIPVKISSHYVAITRGLGGNATDTTLLR
jgi:hypothetical protein